MVPSSLITSDGSTLYEKVGAQVAALIESGTFGVGERVPSVRKLSAQLGVSVTTVLEAYRKLEDQGLIEARPQSGYYVRERRAAPEPAMSSGKQRATRLDTGDLIMRIVNEASRSDLVPLGAAVPSPDLLPTTRLNQILARVVRDSPNESFSYDTVPGNEALRIQIARRMLEAGVAVGPDEIVTMPGAQTAMVIALRAVTRPGDTVIIESPTYYGLLEILEALGLRALELATNPRTGICLDDLGHALRDTSVAALVLQPSFGNPLGHVMPDEKKARLMEIVREHDLAVLEDDVYGELAFEGSRPKALRAFDPEGRVMLCSSFSKTLSPGYRIGWCVPGRYQREVERFKFTTSVACPSPTQMAVARYLESGGFDRLMRRIRRQYRDLVARTRCAVTEHFPEGTRIARPEGGHVLWIELPGDADSIALHELALEAGISIAPGPIFSATGRYRNCLRLNCAFPWSPRTEGAVAALGALAARV